MVSMKKRRPSVAKRRDTSRRWHIPPPLIHGPETLEGGGILNEWNNELGVLLWQASRDAMLWATSFPEDRGLVYARAPQTDAQSALDVYASGESDRRLHAGLHRLQQLVEVPADARDHQISNACRQISEWAHERGRPATALAFAQGAALVARTDPTAAFWVATLAVRMNDHARAEVWFRRAIGLARQARDWRMYSRAFSGLGNLYMRRGNLPAARRLHTRALRGARRGGMRREQAAALHDLFAVAVETATPQEADRLARQALEAYGTRNRRVYVLAHDVAYHWMEQGYFTRALTIFQAVLPLIDRPLERLLVFANLARAAGGTGDVGLADEAADEVSRLVAETELESGVARALLEVARGHLSLGNLDKSRAAAADALQSAIRFREGKVRFAAESLLQTIDSPRLHSSAAVVDGDGPAAPGDVLAADFVRALETIAGATP